MCPARPTATSSMIGTPKIGCSDGAGGFLFVRRGGGWRGAHLSSAGSHPLFFAARLNRPRCEARAGERHAGHGRGGVGLLWVLWGGPPGSLVSHREPAGRRPARQQRQQLPHLVQSHESHHAAVERRPDNGRGHWSCGGDRRRRSGHERCNQPIVWRGRGGPRG